MGADKAMVPLRGKPMLMHVLEQITPLFSNIVISTRELRENLPCQQIIDASEDRGPMVGIITALEAVESDWLFVIACDMPFVSHALIRLLATNRDAHDAVVSHVHGRVQPLFGFYAKTSLPMMKRQMQQGQRSMIRLLDKLNSSIVSEQQVREIDPQFESLISLDSIEDVKKWSV